MKISTPLLLASIFFSFISKAQNTPNCNAVFDIIVSNSNTVKFAPAITTDSPLVRHEWNFGDASVITHLIAPIHSYTAPGTFTVKHSISRFSSGGALVCTEAITKQVVIQLPCSLIASFNWHPDSSNYQKIHFTNNSSPFSSSDSIKWTFGDGTSSRDINPTHVYANAGTYNVCITVKTKGTNAGSQACLREICKTIIISQPCNLQANFKWDPVVGKPGGIAFQNLSLPLSPLDSVRWTFGDGSSSLDVNAIHTYENAGTYTACLRVKTKTTATGANPCVKEICIVVTVIKTCNLVADFNWGSAAGNPLSIVFQNLSTTISTTDSVRWTFGDGSSSQDRNIKHTYNHSGTYTVCLRVKKNGNTAGTALCVKEICKVVTILPQKNCDSVHVNFTYKRDPLLPNKIYFTAYGNTTILDQYWTITRLYTASQPYTLLRQKNPGFLFNDTGYYSVCLKAVDVEGCAKTYCSMVRIEKLPPECGLHAYPNPAGNEVNVAVQLLQPEMIHVFVYNGMNVLVKEKNQQGNNGSNRISINIHEWKQGLYTIKVVYGNKTCYARFTKF
ncbi:MAG: PKD domain-containing protein [Ferruginibacter sp.]